MNGCGTCIYIYMCLFWTKRRNGNILVSCVYIRVRLDDTVDSMNGADDDDDPVVDGP